MEEEQEWKGDFNPMADPEERRHLLSVLDSFRYVTSYMSLEQHR